LIPVKASVFDDDFFQASSCGERISEESGPTHFSPVARVQVEEVSSVAEEVFPSEASVRAPSFGGGVAAVDHTEPDELDIPAFLRRGN
jgi:cell division protein FtsZ